MTLQRLRTYADDHLDKRDAKPSIFDQLRYSAGIRRLNIELTREALIAANVANAATITADQVLAIAHTIRLKLVTATDAEKRASEDYLRYRNLAII